MTGSNLVLIVVPIVMVVALGTWLGLVMYAGAHPEWKAQRLAREARQAREAQQARKAAAAAETEAPPVPASAEAPVRVPARGRGAPGAHAA
jgi:hypothetical protein